MTEVAGPLWRRVVFWLLLAAALGLAASNIMTAFQNGVSFDGAMNMQVANSLAEGKGYRRSYGDQVAFPQEIETKLPFILPAALIYYVFGVGLVSSQLPGVLYFISCLGAIYCIVRRFLAGANASWAWLAVLACTLTPGMQRYGFHGYGEIAALSWFLWGCLVLFSHRVEEVRGRRVLVAGLLLGLAVATKIVLLIGVGAAICAFFSLGICHKPLRGRVLTANLLLLGLGLVLAQLPQEIMHYASEKSAADFVQWWAHQIRGVAHEAGVQNGLGDTGGPWTKLGAHFTLLARQMEIAPSALGLFALGGAGLGVMALLRTKSTAAFRILLVVGIATAVYFFWWMLITPTAKAWHRRVFDGVVLFQFLSVLSMAALFQKMSLNVRRIDGWVLLVAIVFVLQADVQFARNALPSAATQRQGRSEFASVIDYLKSRDQDGLIFGEGWYSGPALSLYSGRPFLDLNQWPPTRLAPKREIYLALDSPAIAGGAFREVRRRYESEKLFPEMKRFQIYRLDLQRNRPPFEKMEPDASLAGEVDFSRRDYAWSTGFNAEKNQTWRWMRCEGSALLRYAGEEFAYLKGSAPSLQQYRFAGGLRFEVQIDGKAVASEAITQGGDFFYRWPISQLGLSPGAAATFSITCDNVLMTPDLRQLALLVSAFGFSVDSK